MKNQYTRPTINFDNWIVTTENIKRIYDFFLQRFSVKQIEITLETEEGNNRVFENFDEFTSEIPIIEKNKEVIKKIQIIHRVNDIKDFSNTYKQMCITIQFHPYSEASFNIIAGDKDKSNRDWVAGTYEQIQKIKESLMIDDPRIISILKSRFQLVLFDPSGKIENSIKEEIKSKGNKVVATPPRKNIFVRMINNLWVIGIGTLIIGTLVLHYIFKIF